jgi:hypothetical protein
VAVFDSDGAPWCEKPMYIQLDFLLRRWVPMVGENPALAAEQPWKATGDTQMLQFAIQHDWKSVFDAARGWRLRCTPGRRAAR